MCQERRSALIVEYSLLNVVASRPGIESRGASLFWLLSFPEFLGGVPPDYPLGRRSPSHMLAPFPEFQCPLMGVTLIVTSMLTHVSIVRYSISLGFPSILA